MNDFESLSSRYEQYRKALGGIRPSNKAALFDALAGAGITRVLVSFDGQGDSGQIESVLAYRGDERAELPSARVTLQHLSWGETQPSAQEQSFPDAIEALCYDCLEEQHDGWEIDDGAFGQFQFHVSRRVIELEFNGRVIDYATSKHEL